MKMNQAVACQNQVLVQAWKPYGLRKFSMVFLALLLMCVTFSSFKKGDRTNPYPFYAFTIFTYDFTDLNGNDYGSIEVNFYDDDNNYPQLTSPIYVGMLTSVSKTVTPHWDLSGYCYTNQYMFASGVEMYDAAHNTLNVYMLPARDGDHIPMNAW